MTSQISSPCKWTDHHLNQQVMGRIFTWVCLLSSVSSSLVPYKTSIVQSGRLLVSFFGYPDKCVYGGTEHACTFSIACWLVGGSMEQGCTTGSGDSMADLMFTCCIPPSSNNVNHLLTTNYNYNNRLSAATPTECGLQMVGIQKRIIGGNEAFFGELPWQAHIRIKGYQCGGVLISHVLVATAAHCVHRARIQDIRVHLGDYDTQNTGHYIEPLPEEVHHVVQKIIHPKFQYRLSQPDRFDIALVQLSKPVTYRENILPICLPNHDDSYNGQTGVVAGWGRTDNEYGKTGTNILHKASVPILSDEECFRWHRRKSINLELHQEMLCAGHSDGHTDACLGDSGGPLIVYDVRTSRWTLAGITSAGFGCAVDHQPGIYHKVAFTSDWIKSYIIRSYTYSNR
ncbi:serine proteinase stubble [Nilaparvata lugens]|uniref:serine proteinase stubble n=1 Tax=Nilaparvata lugens TaxID=108931 RepID=UPI00193D982F|nr:serine proteinase stubble [Nilaparvata lugens]